MLQNIRDNIQGTAAKVIIALIVVPFALFGIDSLFNTSSQTPAAVVNGEKISQQELAQAVALQKRRLVNMMGDNIDPTMLDDNLLRGQALDSLVKQQLLLQAANRSRMVVSNQQLNTLIVTMPQFMEEGRFSQQRYEQMLRLQGYSSAFFKQLLRSDLTIQQVSNAIASSSFVTDAQLQQAARLLHESRDFQYVDIPLAPIEQAVKIEEQEITDWYGANTQRYLSEEKLRFSYIELDESLFVEPVSEQDIQREFQSVLEADPGVTEREVAHILFEQAEESDEEFAARIAAVESELKAGADFAELAKQHSADLGSAADGGALGFTSGDSFPPEFEQALMSLQPGQVSAVVETEAGSHLIKLLSVREPEKPKLEELREELVARLSHRAAQPKLIAAVEELKDLVFNAENLRMPAEELQKSGLNIRVQQSSLMSRTDTSGLFAYEALRQAAFSPELREQGLNSEVLELAEGHYAVLHVEEYLAPKPLPLEQVREQIVQAIKRDKAEQLAEQKARALADKIRAGEALEQLAASEGLQWQAVLGAKRSQLGLAPELLKKVFAMPRGTASAVSAAFLQKNNGDWVAICLGDVQQGNVASLDDSAKRELQTGLASSQASQSFSAYFNSLWSNAEVKLN